MRPAPRGCLVVRLEARQKPASNFAEMTDQTFGALKLSPTSSCACILQCTSWLNYTGAQSCVRVSSTKLLASNRDEYAGRTATGPASFGTDLHQERLSRHSLLQLYRSRGASCARDPAKSGNRCGRASILFVAFCPRVLNIRHAIPAPGPRDGNSRRACRVRRSDARERLPDCPDSFAHDAGLNRILLH